MIHLCAIQRAITTELREYAPLNKWSNVAGRGACADPRTIASFFCVLSVAITIALFTQIYYGDFEVSAHGSVASSAGACSQAGADALRAGGGALDAAAAAALCLAVVAPHRAGFDASGSLMLWDYRSERSQPPVVAQWGGASRSVGSKDARPRLLGALAFLHARFGRLPWSKILQPALDLVILYSIADPSENAPPKYDLLNDPFPSLNYQKPSGGSDTNRPSRNLARGRSERGHARNLSSGRNAFLVEFPSARCRPPRPPTALRLAIRKERNSKFGRLHTSFSIRRLFYTTAQKRQRHVFGFHPGKQARKPMKVVIPPTDTSNPRRATRTLPTSGINCICDGRGMGYKWKVGYRNSNSLNEIQQHKLLSTNRTSITSELVASLGLDLEQPLEDLMNKQNLTRPQLAAFLTELQQNTSHQLAEAWSPNVTITDAKAVRLGEWIIQLPTSQPAADAAVRALSPLFENEASFSTKLAGSMKRLQTEGGWPPAGIATGIAVIDTRDVYVSLVMGLSDWLGTKQLSAEGWLRDDKGTSPPPPAILAQEQTCGERYVVGAGDTAALVQVMGALTLSEAGLSKAVEQPRTLPLLTGGLGLEARTAASSALVVALNAQGIAQDAPRPYPSVNVVQQSGDVLGSHADSRGECGASQSNQIIKTTTCSRNESVCIATRSAAGGGAGRAERCAGVALVSVPAVVYSIERCAVGRAVPALYFCIALPAAPLYLSSRRARVSCVAFVCGAPPRSVRKRSGDLPAEVDQAAGDVGAA
ncbi:Glutathione hydrolase 6 [Eumeta japonica]|uniref:Glutathione hydrolase 6 n=1 Tax=Eumeta variegata TaxID=151549 RepID=A0A4C1U2X4_EUMVA|nr:Glutathione hydrolase 6 [Eumeta japonica]